MLTVFFSKISCAIAKLLIIVPSENSLSEGSPYMMTAEIEYIKDRNKNTKFTLFSEPYITWGPVNLKSVRDLIYKRGFVKVDGKRTPITSNDIIERKYLNVNLIIVNWKLTIAVYVTTI